MANEYDVVVIGAGTGGYVAAIRAAQVGLKVACVERDPLGTGGTCLLRGCIPTKALLHTADLYDDLKHGREYGIVADTIGIDFTALMGRKQRIVTRLSKGIESYLFKKNKITLFKGQGRLEGPRTVVVKAADGAETKVATKNVILATGSRPRTLPGLTPDWSDLCMIAKAAGLDYRGLIGEILSGAIRRYKERERERREARKVDEARAMLVKAAGERH